MLEGRLQYCDHLGGFWDTRQHWWLHLRDPNFSVFCISDHLFSLTNFSYYFNYCVHNLCSMGEWGMWLSICCNHSGCLWDTRQHLWLWKADLRTLISLCCQSEIYDYGWLQSMLASFAWSLRHRQHLWVGAENPSQSVFCCSCRLPILFSVAFAYCVPLSLLRVRDMMGRKINITVVAFETQFSI